MRIRDFVHKKKLGQNFLKSTEHIVSLLEAIELSERDRVLEIGPGLGAITDFL
ncbi:MAG: rRNA adenine N-6-methyltransferase family protein, partial [Candidatus Dojkabacteria bacterium]